MTVGNQQDRQVLLTLWLLIFASSSQVMVVAPLLSSIEMELGVDKELLGSLMTVYAATVGVFALITGPISDRVGRRRVLLWGCAVMAVALGLHGVAWSFSSLLAFRALAGVGGGMLSGAVVAFVGDYFPAERRGWANGWIMSGLAAGQIVGVPLATLLAGSSGYQIPFLVFAVAMALATLSVLRFIPRIETQPAHLTLRSVFGVYGGLLRRGATLAATLTYAGLFFGIASLMAYLPTWLETSLGFSTTMIAMLYLTGGVGTLYAGPRAGALSDRVGRRSVILWASAGVVVFTLMMPSLVVLVSAIAFQIFVGVNVFFASRSSAFQALLTELVGSTERGSLMSLATAAGQVGFASGAAVAGPTFVTHGVHGKRSVRFACVGVRCSACLEVHS